MLRNLSFAAVFAVLTPAAQSAWASTTDPQTIDPHGVNSAPVLGFLNNVYEGLVRHRPDTVFEPALATSWEPFGNGPAWRFDLRRDVTFQDGAALTAQDVPVSHERAASDAADTSSWFAPVSDVIIVDDHTVDIISTAANNANHPDKERGNHATSNANGTGALAVITCEPVLRSVLKPHASRWGEALAKQKKRIVSWNFGGYANAQFDAFLPMIQSETDEAARQAMRGDFAQILQRDTAYVPFYGQPLMWGTRANVDLVQRPDHFFTLRWVGVN